MIWFFGLNEFGATHRAHPWKPVQLSPNAYRFNFPWNNSVDSLRDIIARPGDALNLYDNPYRIGIAALHAGGATPVPPSTDAFYWKVREFLSPANTPSNLVVQIWNEPNNPGFGEMTATDCLWLVRAARIAAVDVGALSRIIGPGLTPTPPPNSNPWGQDMATIYQDHNVPAAVHIYPTTSNWYAEFDDALKVADRANSDPVDPNKPIWITEMGFCEKWHYAVNGVHPNRCGPGYATYAGAAYDRANQRSNVVGVFYHRLHYPAANESQQAMDFDTYGKTYFLNQSHNPTTLVGQLDQYR